MTTEASNLESSLKGKKFIQDCEVLGTKNVVTKDEISDLLNLWKKFQAGHGNGDFGDADQCLESLLICTSRLVLNSKYSKEISAILKQELKEVIVKCGNTFTDSPHRKRLCDGISSIVENPWGASKFQEVVNTSSQNTRIDEVAAEALWDTEGWVLLEARMECMARGANANKGLLDRLCSVLHVLVEKGHEIFRHNTDSVSESEAKSFHPYRFPYRKYVEYLEVYALLYCNDKVTIQVADLCEEWVLLDVITSLIEKTANPKSIRLFPKLKIWKSVSDTVKKVAKNATWRALKSKSSIMLKEFFALWMKLSCSDNEEGLEHPGLMELVDEIYKKMGEIARDNVYKLAQFTIEIMGITPFTRPKYLELFTAAMLADISAIEKFKASLQENTDTDEIRDMNRKFSLRYLDLAIFFKDYPKTAKHCLLTAFCLNPCYKLYCLLFPNSISEKENINIASDNDFISDEYRELKDIRFDQCDPEVEEELGLGSSVLDDLVIVIENPRYKGLVGVKTEDEKRAVCLKLLDSKSVTAIENKTLDHLDVDYEKYKDLKPQYDPDDDGIEKGYRPGERRNFSKSFSKKLLSGSSQNSLLKARKNAIKCVRKFPIQGKKTQSTTPRKGRPPKVKISEEANTSSGMLERLIPNIALCNNPWFSFANYGGMYMEFYHQCCSREELPSKEDRQGRNFRHEERLIKNVRLMEPDNNDNPDITAAAGFTAGNMESNGTIGSHPQNIDHVATSEIGNLDISLSNSVAHDTVIGEPSLRTEAPVPQLPNGSFNVTENSTMFTLGQQNCYYADPTNGPLCDLLYAYQRQRCLNQNAPDEKRKLSLKKHQLKRKKQQEVKNPKRSKMSDVDNIKNISMEKSERKTNRRLRKFPKDVPVATEPTPSNFIGVEETNVRLGSEVSEAKSEVSNEVSEIGDNGTTPSQVSPIEELVISSPVPVAVPEPPPKPEPEFAGAFLIMGSWSCKVEKSENEEAQFGDLSSKEPSGTGTTILCNAGSRKEQPLNGNSNKTVIKVSNEQKNVPITLPAPAKPVQDTITHLAVNVNPPEFKAKSLKTYTNKRRRLVINTRWSSSSETGKLDEYKSAMPKSVPVNDDSIQSSCNQASLSNSPSERAPADNDKTLESSQSVEVGISLSTSNIHSDSVASSSYDKHEETSKMIAPQTSEATVLPKEETSLNSCQIPKENSHASEVAISPVNETSSQNDDIHQENSSISNQHETVKIDSTERENKTVLLKQSSFVNKQVICDLLSPEKENQNNGECIPLTTRTVTKCETTTTVESCLNDPEIVGDQQKESEPQKPVDEAQQEQGHMVLLTEPRDNAKNLQQTADVKLVLPSATESGNVIPDIRENTNPIDTTVEESKQSESSRENNAESKVTVSLKKQLQSLCVSHIQSLLVKPKNKPAHCGGSKDASPSVSSSVSESCDNELSNKEKDESSSNVLAAKPASAGAEVENKFENLNKQKDKQLDQLENSTSVSNNSLQKNVDTIQPEDTYCNDKCTGISNNNQKDQLNEITYAPTSFEGQNVVTDTFTDYQANGEQSEGLPENSSSSVTVPSKTAISTCDEEMLNNEKENFQKESSDFHKNENDDTQILFAQNSDQSNKNVQDHSACHSQDELERTTGDLDAVKDVIQHMLDSVDNKEKVMKCEKSKHENNEKVVSDEMNLTPDADVYLKQKDTNLITVVDDVEQVSRACVEEKDRGAVTVSYEEDLVLPSSTGSTGASNFASDASADKEDLQSQESQPLVSTNSQTEEEDEIELIDLGDDDDTNSLSGEELADATLNFEAAQGLDTNLESKVISSLLPHTHGVPTEIVSPPRSITPVSVLEDAINKKLKKKNKRPYEEEDRIKVAQSVVKHFETYSKPLRRLLQCYVKLEVIPPEQLPEKARNQNPVKRSTRIRNKRFRVSELIKTGNLFADSKNRADNTDDSSLTSSDQCGSDSDSDIQIIKIGPEDINSNPPEFLTREAALSSQDCHALTENSTTTPVYGSSSMIHTRVQTAKRGSPLLPERRKNVGQKTRCSSPLSMTGTPSKRKCGESSILSSSRTYEATSTQNSKGFDSGSTTEAEEDDPNGEFSSTALSQNAPFVSGFQEVTSPENPIELDGMDPLAIDDSVVPADINAFKNGSSDIVPPVSIHSDSFESDYDVMDYEEGGGPSQATESTGHIFDVAVRDERSCITSKNISHETLLEDSDSDIEVIGEVKSKGRGKGLLMNSCLSTRVKSFVTRNNQPIKPNWRSTRLTTDQSSNNPTSSLSPDENIIVPENIADMVAGAQEADQVSVPINQELGSNLGFTPCSLLEEDVFENTSAKPVESNYILPDAADQSCPDEDAHQQEHTFLESESENLAMQLEPAADALQSRANDYSGLVVQENSDDEGTPSPEPESQQSPLGTTQDCPVVTVEEDKSENNSQQDALVNQNSLDTIEKEDENSPYNDVVNLNVEESTMEGGTVFTERVPNEILSENNACDESQDTIDQNEVNSQQDALANQNSVDTEEKEDENSLYNDAVECNVQESTMTLGELFTEQELDKIVSEDNECNESQDTIDQNEDNLQQGALTNRNSVYIEEMEDENSHSNDTVEHNVEESAVVIQGTSFIELEPNKVVAEKNGCGESQDTIDQNEDSSHQDAQTNLNSVDMEETEDENSHSNDAGERINVEESAMVKGELFTAQEPTEIISENNECDESQLSQDTIDQNEDNSHQGALTNQSSVDTEEMEYENSPYNDAVEHNVEESAMVEGTVFTEQELNETLSENNKCDESQDTFTTVPSPTNDIAQQPMSPEIPRLDPENITCDENNSWLSDDEPPTLEIEKEIVL